MDRSKANPDEHRVKPEARTPWLEWVSSGVGLLLVLVVFGLIGWQAINDASEPPAIAVDVGNVTPVPGGFRVEFRARNTGGSAGAQVEIEGVLSGGGADEISRVVFDYVPGHSVRRGGLFFTHDPRIGHLSLRARGYSAP
jgi:uncharacterized protein (TIGR02588 family)